MTPLVTDQIDAAGAFVSLETNVQPEKLWPSNSSIFLVGWSAGPAGCAATEKVAAQKIKTEMPRTQRAGEEFMRSNCPPRAKKQLRCRITLDWTWSRGWFTFLPLKIEATFQAESRAAWRRWLTQNYARADGIWLITFKKHSGRPHLDYADAVEEGLCFGWVDSKPGKVDAQRSKLWFAPRKPGTGWSKLNKERAERLIAAGSMHAAGLAKIAAAQADGSWSKLDAVEALEIPADLAQAFRQHAGSAKNFEAFPRSVKRSILEWILQAKKPETRAKRVTETASLAAKNIRANQWRQ